MRPAPGVLLLLFSLILIVPSAGVHLFSGLPLSTPAEFLTTILLVPLVLSRGLRRLYGRLLGRGGTLPRRILLYGGLLGLGIKAVLLAGATPAGFLACYRSPVAPPVSGSCERSYENPFFRFGATRVDRTIDFGAEDWNLSFINSRRFNFFPTVEGSILRDRLPISVTWHGTVELAEAQSVEITYVGRATVDLGAEPVTLPPRYDVPVTVAVALPPGPHPLAIAYGFDDGYRVGRGPIPGPYATFRVRLRADGRPVAPLAPAPSPGAWRTLGLLVDVVVAGFVLSVLWLYGRVVAREWPILVGVVVLGTAIHAYLPDSGWLARSRGILGLVWLLLVALVVANTRRRLLVSYVALAYLSLLRIGSDLPNLNGVLYRSPGHDWLAYESLARSILETWSLEGGEKVFSYQPLSRYARFLAHLVFGDGDGLLSVFGLLALNASILLLFARLYGRRPRAARPVPVHAAPVLLLLALANSTTVIGFVELGASEYPAWLFLFLLFPMLFASRRPTQWLVGTGLLGLSLLARANHAPAVLTMFVVFFVPAVRRRPRVAVAAAGLLGAVTLLPAVHDGYYGGQMILVPVDATLPINLELPPSQLLRVGTDPKVRALAESQIWGMLYRASVVTRSGPESRQLALGFYGLQLLWAVLALPVLLGRKCLSPTARLLWPVPALYLGVHLFYVQFYYYPRHIVIGHLAMGIVSSYLLSQVARAPRSGANLERCGNE